MENCLTEINGLPQLCAPQFVVLKELVLKASQLQVEDQFIMVNPRRGDTAWNKEWQKDIPNQRREFS